MVDQQTPQVRSDEELEREDAAAPDTQARRDDAGDLDVEAHRQAQADTEERAARAERDARDERDLRDERDARGPSEDPDLKVRHAATTDGAGAGNPALFDRDASRGYQDRWLIIQTEFVDSPKDAVQKAEQLVGEVMQALTETFARQRRDLEAGLSRNDNASTEDLRLAIRRYRSFFNRLLAL